jgi:hypothetical protein
MNFNQIKYGRVAIFLNGVGGAISVGMLWGKKTLYNWGQTTIDLWGDTTPAILANSIATTHYNRVIADGGVLPAGISGLSTVLESVVLTYQVTDSTDFNTKVPVFLDPSYTGYKLGAGSGTTLGQAARTVYAISSSADVTQTTAASQPLLLAHSGVNYWWGSGVASNYVTTPSSVANSIVGDIEIIAKVNMPNLTTQFNIIGKYGNTAPAQNYILYINSSNKIAFAYNNGQTQISSVIQPYADNTDFWVKFTRASISGDIYFYTSSNGSTWTQLGTLVSSVAGAITTSTQQVEVGSLLSGAIVTTGKIYRATISNSIGGSPVVDFNPATYNAATSQTAWTSSTGEVWTINTGTATTGYKGVLVDRTVMQANGSNNSITSSITVSQPDTIYCANTILSDNTVNSSFLFDSANAANRQLIYQTGSTGGFVKFNIAAITEISNSYSVQVAKRNLFASIFNGASSSAILNNSTTVSGNAGTQSLQGIILFSRYSSSSNGNAIINTFIVSSQSDNSTVRTSMYNLIRSMNNSAF